MKWTGYCENTVVVQLRTGLSPVTNLQGLRKTTKHVIQVTIRQVLSSKWFYCYCMCDISHLVSKYQSSGEITASILRINAKKHWHSSTTVDDNITPKITVGGNTTALSVLSSFALTVFLTY